MGTSTNERFWTRAQLDAALRRLAALIPRLQRACPQPRQFAQALRLATADIDAHAGPYRDYANRRIDSLLANLTIGTPPNPGDASLAPARRRR